MPTIRSDIVDVYIFRRGRRRGTIELLQLQRAMEAGSAMAGTWQPVMGHVEAGETGAACAKRELEEEVGLKAGDPALLGLWALEQVHPYYIAGKDQIVLSPRFAAEVAVRWEPRLNHEHTGFRWVDPRYADRNFMWPGQLASIGEVLFSLVPEHSLSREKLRVT